MKALMNSLLLSMVFTMVPAYGQNADAPARYIYGQNYWAIDPDTGKIPHAHFNVRPGTVTSNLQSVLDSSMLAKPLAPSEPLAVPMVAQPAGKFGRPRILQLAMPAPANLNTPVKRTSPPAIARIAKSVPAISADSHHAMEAKYATAVTGTCAPAIIAKSAPATAKSVPVCARSYPSDVGYTPGIAVAAPLNSSISVSGRLIPQ